MLVVSENRWSGQWDWKHAHRTLSSTCVNFNTLSPGQYEDLSTNLPTRDDLRLGEVDLEEPPIGQETMAPSFVALLPSGTVVDPLQNTPTCLPSGADPVSEPACRGSDVPIDESSVAPGSMQISPRESAVKVGWFEVLWQM